MNPKLIFLARLGGLAVGWGVAWAISEAVALFEPNASTVVFYGLGATMTVGVFASAVSDLRFAGVYRSASGGEPVYRYVPITVGVVWTAIGVAIGYFLWWPSNSLWSWVWWIVAVVLTLAGLGALAIGLFGSDERIRTQVAGKPWPPRANGDGELKRLATPEDKFKRLGGWLPFVAFICASAALFSVFEIFRIAPGLWSPRFANIRLTTTVAFIFAVVSAVLSSWALILLIQKSKRFPSIFVYSLLWRVGKNAFEVWVLRYISPESVDLSPISASLLYAAVLVPYVLLSSRVRNTFVQ